MNFSIINTINYSVITRQCCLGNDLKLNFPKFFEHTFQNV